MGSCLPSARPPSHERRQQHEGRDATALLALAAEPLAAAPGRADAKRGRRAPGNWDQTPSPVVTAPSFVAAVAEDAEALARRVLSVFVPTPSDSCAHCLHNSMIAAIHANGNAG